MGKDIFISHAWGNDSLKRNNHERSKEIANYLIKKNYNVWFDEYDIYGNIDNSIMKGINNAKIIIICLTKRYCDKINKAVNNNFLNDNCYKEWSYCLFKKKIIIPIVMDIEMRDIYLQDGIVQMYLNNTIYIDCSDKINFNEIIKQINNNNIYPCKQISFNEKIYMPLVLKSIDQFSPKRLNSPSKKHIYKKYISYNNIIFNRSLFKSFYCCNRKKVHV